MIVEETIYTKGKPIGLPSSRQETAYYSLTSCLNVCCNCGGEFIQKVPKGLEKNKDLFKDSICDRCL